MLQQGPKAKYCDDGPNCLRDLQITDAKSHVGIDFKKRNKNFQMKLRLSHRKHLRT